MSSKTLVADDFDAIRQRLAELEADKKPAEEPKAWPMYAGAETAEVVWGHYSAPETDCAWRAPQFNVSITWVQAYFPAVDALLGLPVWAHSPVLSKQPHRGFEVCSEERATLLNRSFSSLGPWAVEYLKEEIDARCRIIESQTLTKNAA